MVEIVSLNVKFVVEIVEGSIASLKVAVTTTPTDISIAPSAGLVEETWGAVVSTIQVREAGVDSTLPAGSLARTSKV